MTPGLDAAIPGPKNPEPPASKVNEPTERPTVVIIGDQIKPPPVPATPENQFEIGVEAPDRAYLKSEAVFLLPPEKLRRQYLVMQFSDAQGKRFECQFLLPIGGNYEEGIKKTFRRLTPINPFPERKKPS